MDISRTVGWFTSAFPVQLRLVGDMPIGLRLSAVKEQLRHTPNHGIGYSLLRYLCTEAVVASTLRAQPQADIRFNYLGQFDQVASGTSLFRRSKEACGPTRSLKGQRTHILVIEGMIAEGRLSLDWNYSADLHRQGTIERLAHLYMQALRAIIAHCLTPDIGAFTPSDFQLTGLDERAFSTIAALLESLDEAEEVCTL